MTLSEFILSKKTILRPLAVGFIVYGILLRLFRITHLDFIFYDEGFYLNVHRFFYDQLVRYYPDNGADLLKAIWFWFKLSLGEGKALWFMMVDARVFFGAFEAWYFPRVLAALSGIATLYVIYVFARKYYDSRVVGLLSCVLLALMPSHVFYSRIAMQETFSTLCFLIGIYLYVFPDKFGKRTFFSAIALAAAFFTNYRMITLPVHVAVCELVLALSYRRLPNFRKYMWNVLTFLFCVFMIGNIDNGNNTFVIFAWMFYQSNLAKDQFDWINLFSYPYYLFRLENFFFGILFFSQIVVLVKRQFHKLLPFVLVGAHMLIYSFASEKGARYLCIMTPFIAMSVAYMIYNIAKRFEKGKEKFIPLALSVLILFGFIFKSTRIASARSDYQTAVNYIWDKNPKAKIISTQNYVLLLFARDKEQIAVMPYQFEKFVELYAQGYRYAMLDPQAYISYSADKSRFDSELTGYMEFIRNKIPPLAVFDHFNDTLLERFVFDHNENLSRSIKFLKDKESHYGQLYIYDVEVIIKTVGKLLS